MNAWPFLDATWARLREWWRRWYVTDLDEATRLQIWRGIVNAPHDPFIRPIGRGRR